MISPSAFNLFKSTVNTMVGQAYQETETHYQKIATVVPSSTAQTVFGWTGMMPKPRLWVGPRVVNEPAPQTYTLVNQIYEDTYGISRIDLDDDQFGIYYRLLPDLARQLKRIKDYWIRDLLEAQGDQASATLQKGYDGLNYFSTSHPVDFYDSSKGTYCNDFGTAGQALSIGGSTVTVGGAFGIASIATMIEYMQVLKAEDGEPMGLTPNLIMIPTLLRLEAQLILKSMFMAPPAWGSISGQVGAADNPMTRFGLDILVNELLGVQGTASPKAYYLLDTTKAVKPLVWSEREAMRMVPRVSETDPIVFDENRYLWGGWGRGAPGWSFSWLMFRSGV